MFPVNYQSLSEQSLSSVPAAPQPSGRISGKYVDQICSPYTSRACVSNSSFPESAIATLRHKISTSSSMFPGDHQSLSEQGLCFSVLAVVTAEHSLLRKHVGQHVLHGPSEPEQAKHLFLGSCGRYAAAQIGITSRQVLRALPEPERAKSFSRSLQSR